jgi:hypothetical protein
MVTKSKPVWTRIVFTFVMTGLLALSLTPFAFAAASKGDIKKAQESLLDKGYDPGRIDGVAGSKTREAIGQYQKAQGLPVTEHLDAQTSEKLGVRPERDSDSAGGKFKAVGQNVGEGGKEFGHEIKKGKPGEAGKDLGKGIGRGGKDAGEGVKDAVTPN